MPYSQSFEESIVEKKERGRRKKKETTKLINFWHPICLHFTLSFQSVCLCSEVEAKHTHSKQATDLLTVTSLPTFTSANAIILLDLISISARSQVFFSFCFGVFQNRKKQERKDESEKGEEVWVSIKMRGLPV